MHFLIEDEGFLEKYTIWDKVSAEKELDKKELDSELVNNKEFLKTEIKSHADEVTNYYHKKFLR